jgi:two-component system response regulator TctD
MRILLVEDNRTLSQWLGRTLEAERYSMDYAYDGDEANHLLRGEHFDLVILDLALPGMDGREVLKWLRARDNPVPVLILTAFDAMQDRLQGLDFGADDYMVKPFDVPELEARIRALLRRGNQQKNPLLACGSLQFDSNARTFTLGGESLALTPREHTVLETLLVRRGRTVSKKALAETMFTLQEEVNPEAVEIYVHRIRKKLEGSDVIIATLRGLGYLLKLRHAAP